MLLNVLLVLMLTICFFNVFLSLPNLEKKMYKTGAMALNIMALTELY